MVNTPYAQIISNKATNANQAESAGSYLISHGIKSEYDFYSFVLNLTPIQAVITNKSQEETASLALLLNIKSIFLAGTSSVYKFSLPEFQVFQTGNNTFELFDSQSNHYTLVISGATDEVNAILSSLTEK